MHSCCIYLFVVLQDRNPVRRPIIVLENSIYYNVILTERNFEVFSIIEKKNQPYSDEGYSNSLYIVKLFMTHSALDHVIFGVCPSASLRQCLHLTIRQTSGVYNLYLGFYGDDLQGITPLQLNTWFHAAFVFDFSTRTQSIYLNGILESSRIAVGTLTLGNGTTVVGYISAIEGYSNNNYFLVSNVFLYMPNSLLLLKSL